MRSPIYFVAALTAAGIAFLLASTPKVERPVVATPSPAEVTPVASQVLVDSGTLVLRVEDMHCEFACFPKVRETLQGFDKVVSVELDEQAEAGTLDNPQVLITYDPGFDLGAARSALAAKGFAKSTIVP